ncbi:hypothetical protein QR680_008313 [Steinernema hermaphroditum]|uniref:Peptidase A1 domain-containing protein n=1 Tax=Steinernema hermaphroditum TaxID=289476 RepID=A0AA39IG62_9BILA|nr:hypothetical protein QR680_008313 [Steinernema hermaphroditum]
MMPKLPVLFLLLLVAVFSPGDARKVNLQIRRHVPKRFGSRSHYHHDPRDENLMTMVLTVGRPLKLTHLQFDTTVADVSLSICPENLDLENEFPPLACYNASASRTFKRFTANTAQDVIKGETFTFITKEYNASANGSEIAGQVGFGWPSLRKYPGDSYYPKDLRSVANLHFGKFNESIFGQVVIATNREYIGMPKQFLTQLTSLHGITWEVDYGAYSVECDRVGSLPDLNFVTAGGVVTVPAKSYVYTWEPLSNGRCVVSFEDSKAFGFGPDWYIGIQIIVDYCVTLYWQDPMITMTKNAWNSGYSGCHAG